MTKDPSTMFERIRKQPVRFQWVALAFVGGLAAAGIAVAAGSSDAATAPATHAAHIDAPRPTVTRTVAVSNPACATLSAIEANVEIYQGRVSQQSFRVTDALNTAATQLAAGMVIPYQVTISSISQAQRDLASDSHVLVENTTQLNQVIKECAG